MSTDYRDKNANKRRSHLGGNKTGRLKQISLSKGEEGEEEEEEEEEEGKGEEEEGEG